MLTDTKGKGKLDWKYEYLINQIHRTAYKKHENYIIGSLIHDKAFANLKPCMQYYVRRIDGRYALIDLYYPQIELAVEIDEPHHSKNEEDDEQRQAIVEEDLRCKFHRIRIASGNIPGQIEELKYLIQERISHYRDSCRWIDWKKPKKIDIYEAKKKFEKTLFVKIKGEIHPDKLMARQTGYWRIANKKREKIKQVIVVHDSVVSRIFSNIRWHSCNTEPNKVGYTGNEIESNELIGSIIENWKFQQTVTYSEDVYK